MVAHVESFSPLWIVSIPPVDNAGRLAIAKLTNGQRGVGAYISCQCSSRRGDQKCSKIRGPVCFLKGRIAERIGVSTRTLLRWDEAGLGLPPVVYLRGRRYRSAAGIEKWERANLRRGGKPSPQRQAQTRSMPRDSAGRLNKPAKPAGQPRRVLARLAKRRQRKSS